MTAATYFMINQEQKITKHNNNILSKLYFFFSIQAKIVKKATFALQVQKG